MGRGDELMQAEMTLGREDVAAMFEKMKTRHFHTITLQSNQDPYNAEPYLFNTALEAFPPNQPLKIPQSVGFMYFFE